MQVRVTLRRAIVGTAGLMVTGVLGALLVAWSGLVGIAASSGHPAWLDWFLELGMRRSIEVHASGIEVPPLDEPGMVELGAGHFQGGCAPCHGSPARPVNPVFASMLPQPPPLSETVRHWREEELFWIVRHGLQYTGMPAWSGLERDDEVWPVVAFLREMPELDEASYNALAGGNAEELVHEPEELVSEGLASMTRTACIRCHGDGEAGPTGPLVPVLAGQAESYLEAALRDYAEGHRESGFMEPVAAPLEAEQRAGLASYYAGLTPLPAQGQQAPDPAWVERGRLLAIEGDASGGVPPCRVCHGGDAHPAYPRLAGQPAPYLEGQLELFRSGGRAGTGTARLMTTIANRLDDEQIADVAAYFQSLGLEAAP